MCLRLQIIHNISAFKGYFQAGCAECNPPLCVMRFIIQLLILKLIIQRRFAIQGLCCGLYLAINLGGVSGGSFRYFDFFSEYKDMCCKQIGISL